MNRFTFCFASIFSLIFIYGCTGTKPGIFTKKTPHEAYQSGLASAGLLRTQLGTLWLAAADRSLQQPVKVTLPYKETGYFAPNDAGASGYLIPAQRGENIVIEVSTRPVTGLLFFVELWEPVAGKSPRFLLAADSLPTRLTYTAERAGDYILRIQPELLQGVSYTLAVTTAPSLAFPINKQDKPRIISTWGVGRDAGARKHEGIDIQAKKRTPVVAVAPGVVTSVSENNLGGKVVFLQPNNSRLNVYYAHLDTQWVQQGQRVNLGDTLGLTGNTGNARNTVSHLHFGIYGAGGAADPLPFVNIDRPAAPEPAGDTALFGKAITINYPGEAFNGMPAVVKAAIHDRYKVELPDASVAFVPIKRIGKGNSGTEMVSRPTLLFDRPDSNAAVITTIGPGNKVAVLGKFTRYVYVRWREKEGWISND